jgi:hypothetical protein
MARALADRQDAARTSRSSAFSLRTSTPTPSLQPKKAPGETLGIKFPGRFIDQVARQQHTLGQRVRLLAGAGKISRFANTSVRL